MITDLLHVKAVHTGGQLWLSSVHLSRPHTESSALISQRHQVEIKDILLTELQNSFADICSLAENNINAETFFKRLHICQMQYLFFALFGLQCSHYLGTCGSMLLILWLLNAEKNPATKVGVSSSCCGHLHGQENGSLCIWHNCRLTLGSKILCEKQINFEQVRKGKPLVNQ